MFKFFIRLGQMYGNAPIYKESKNTDHRVQSFVPQNFHTTPQAEIGRELTYMNVSIERI